MQVCSMSSGSCPSASSTMISPNFSSGAEVIRKGTDRCSFNAASTCSICTFTPPVLIVLSFLPRMRNWFCPFISAMSLVTSSFSQISGAYITKVFSLLRRICMLSKGVYQSEASGPFSLRRAMCDKVSVMP